MTKHKAKSDCIWRFEHENLTLALVWIFINLRRQAIVDFFWKEIPSTLQGRTWFHTSNHIALVNYLDSMGSLWRLMFTRTRKNARNKEYGSLFMDMHRVHKVNWQGWLSLILVINMQYVWTQELGSLSVMLHKPSFVEEGEGTKGSQRWFGRTRGLAIHILVPSVLVFSVLDRRCCATCMGERPWISLHLVILRDLPHTYSCTCLYSKEKQKWKQEGTLPVLTPRSLKFIESKSKKCLKHQILFYYFIFIYLFIIFFGWQSGYDG